MKSMRLLLSVFFTLLTLASSAQKMPPTNYPAAWKKIDQLIFEKGLYKDAHAAILSLYKKAKAEKQAAQQFKALVYQLEIREKLEEFSDTLAIHTLKKEIGQNTGTTRALLHALMAGYYSGYYQQHRWAMYERTSTIQYEKENIRSWNAADFHEAIRYHYGQSLRETALLQSTPLDAFEPILEKGNARQLRPSLYELLAWNALEYFEAGDIDLPSPADAFSMRDPALLGPATEFVQLRLHSTDSTSPHLQALQLYQQLLRHQLAAREGKTRSRFSMEALADADLHRLRFVGSHIKVPNQTRTYRAALERMVTEYAGTATADQAAFLLAETYANAEPADHVTALAICEKVLAAKRENEGSVNCFNLVTRIREKNLSVTTERVNLPMQPFRALVGWNNLASIELRLYRIDDKLRSQLVEAGYPFEPSRWTGFISQHKPIRAWQQVLPGSQDHRRHSTEIRVDGLPQGEYLLLAGDDKQFELKKSTMAASFFHVSNISYINRDHDYLLLHRNSGQPLAKASVQLWHREYDYAARQYRHIRGNQYETNEQGYVKLVSGQGRNARTFRLDIRHGEDRLFLEEDEYNFVYHPSEDESGLPDYENRKAHAYFFTDRGIFRPGQTIQFKAIAVTRDSLTKKAKLIKGRKTLVTLYNANGEKLDSLHLTTNDYGSYAGSFKIPESGLTGEFRIEDESLHGSITFRVEEYKRPKFYASFEPMTGTYRVNDTVTVRGTAKAYAGNAISNAKLTYRVKRNARFLYPWKIGRIGWPRMQPQEISHGSLQTGEDGSFSISFPAVPDERIDRETDPVFDYEVSVDITDLNGESRSASTIVPVSYKAIRLSVRPPALRIEAGQFSSLKVETQNMGGQFERCQVSLSIRPLLSPGRLVRERLWAQPDLYLMTEADFIASFPHDEYRNESDPATWARGAVLWQKTDSSQASGSFGIGAGKLPGGWYLVEAVTVDRYGDSVRDQATVFLYDPKSPQLPVPAYISVHADKQVSSPGESVTLEFGTSADKLYVVRYKANNSSTEPENEAGAFSQRYSLLRPDNQVTRENIPVLESDLGGFGVEYVFVKHNRVFSSRNLVSVPWKEKELDIRLQTWRDKTLPGSEEKWTVTVSGSKGEKMAAELLAGMYDASLDQFYPHRWDLPAIWPGYQGSSQWSGRNNFTVARAWEEAPLMVLKDPLPVIYDRLLTNIPGDLSMEGMITKNILKAKSAADKQELVAEMRMEAPRAAREGIPAPPPPNGENAPEGEAVKTAKESGTVKARKDFRETAFFFPQLTADEKGNYSFSFTMPEALTSWKWQLLAHTPELALGFREQQVITQKELMVQPNLPRFLREGDRLEISTKIVNLSDREITGQAELQLLDATTNQPVDGWFRNFFPNQYFTVAAGGSESVKFPIEVPYLFDKALTWRIIARSGNLADGEEASLPVLGKRQLVTETLPFSLQGSGSREYRLTKLAASKDSESLSHRSLTVEFSSNPAWYAVQALPYLADYPYECSEQTFNRLYANLLAAFIVDRLPRIRQVMEKWQGPDSSALVSNLLKNPELKQVLLEETPWVLEARTESEQKQKVAGLFNLVKMAANREQLTRQLLEMQTPNGGFSWFRGGPDDRYITQYIVSGIGRLKKLGALPALSNQLDQVVNRALPYLDARIKEDYERRDKNPKAQAYLNYYAVQYLYMRSYFPEKGIPGTILPAVTHFRKNITTHWLKGNLMAKGMIALTLYRTGDRVTANRIMASLEQGAILNEELGMYWKTGGTRYYWQDAQVESQALAIEAFAETNRKAEYIAALKLWLLRNKQANHWPSTKATSDACYALLLRGADWLESEPRVSVDLGGLTTISPEKAEAGTGYYKKTIPGTGVNAEMADIKIKAEYPAGSKNLQPVFGAVYWQYFEDPDKVSAAAGPLRLRKQVMLERLTDKGPVLEPVTDGSLLRVGDKLKVRLEIVSDRSMEYVHVRDMRASALEPVNVLSGYRWQGSLGYYESTRDASTNFFIHYLPKGTHVIEYALFVSHAGMFTNGISSIQCMYAPEFSSHSEGVRITVE